MSELVVPQGVIERITVGDRISWDESSEPPSLFDRVPA
jgi:hypothetical protein